MAIVLCIDQIPRAFPAILRTKTQRRQKTQRRSRRARTPTPQRLIRHDAQRRTLPRHPHSPGGRSSLAPTSPQSRLRRKPNQPFSMPENNIRSVKQKPFTPPTTSPTELTTYIGTPPKKFCGHKNALGHISANVCKTTPFRTFTAHQLSKVPSSPQQSPLFTPQCTHSKTSDSLHQWTFT
ncbi:transposase-like protein [Corynebacterium diphtheriae bv. mitis]|nr:hypothetical protein CIP107554_00223 [Corynebacterium diphtheriae]SUY73034.1 transposase-like protein [Corynebacterium diphtheriae bv. mitis]